MVRNFISLKICSRPVLGEIFPGRGCTKKGLPRIAAAPVSVSSKNSGKELFAYGEILNKIGSRDLSGYTNRMRVTENKYSDNILVGINSGNKMSSAVTASTFPSIRLIYRA